MFWVGVRYRGIALPDIMKVMRVWLDQRRFEVKTFDFMISGSGTLVCAAFATETEATEFAQAFAGFVSRECPSIERGMERTETSTDSTESASRAM
jgi:4-diphosphocytidyl-2C-methyl-D-erythritol kinase